MARMTELLTAAQMKAIERAAIESGRVTGLELMERAGRGVIEAVFAEWPELAKAPYRAVVLCGPGNNGGDGFVVARLLKEWGWEVEVFLYGDPARLPPDAQVNYERWIRMGAVETFSSRVFEERTIGRDSAIVVDALFGTGLSRPVDLPLVALSDMPEAGTMHRLVAVDIPSGLCADSGRPIVGGEVGQGGIAAPADLTVTFHGFKVGHFLSEGPGDCGKTVVRSIGLEGNPREGVQTPPGRPAPLGDRHGNRLPAAGRFATMPPGDAVDLIEEPSCRLAKSASKHKYAHGHALILAGGSGRTGAARLAARGALRIGAGLVMLGVPGSAQLEVASQVTAIMLRRAGTPEELAGLLEDARIGALCLGPGLGSSDERASLVETALKSARAVVLDADALTLIGRDAALFALLHENCVLTPHGGEFARLFPDIAEKLAAPATRGPAWSRVDATRAAAARAGCVVLFKGPDTVIAAPDGRCSINSAAYERAAPWLATAGSGDVLAGFIAGLLARGSGPMQAAETAAWLHVECARAFGPGLIAEDLPEALPGVLRALGV